MKKSARKIVYSNIYQLLCHHLFLNLFIAFIWASLPYVIVHHCVFQYATTASVRALSEEPVQRGFEGLFR